MNAFLTYYVMTLFFQSTTADTMEMYTDKMRLGKLDVIRAVNVLMTVEASINVAVCKYIVALKQSFLQSILDWKSFNLCQPGNYSCFYCHLLSVNQLKSKLAPTS